MPCSRPAIGTGDEVAVLAGALVVARHGDEAVLLAVLAGAVPGRADQAMAGRVMSKQPVYGFPHVADPNDFIPDGECCSPEEIETHRIACNTYGKPNHKPNVGCADLIDPGTGQWVGHVTRTSWGIGVNLIQSCDDCGEPVDDVIACHDCGRDFCLMCWPKHAESDEP